MNISSRHNIVSLKEKDEIKKLFINSKKIRLDFGTLFIANQKKDSKIRVAILVKKVCGNAVQRNKIKRLIRSAIRVNQHLIKKNNRILILYSKKSAVSYRSVESQLTTKMI